MCLLALPPGGSAAEVADFGLSGPAGPLFQIKPLTAQAQDTEQSAWAWNCGGTHAAVPFMNSSTAWQ